MSTQNAKLNYILSGLKWEKDGKTERRLLDALNPIFCGEAPLVTKCKDKKISTESIFTRESKEIFKNEKFFNEQQIYYNNNLLSGNNKITPKQKILKLKYNLIMYCFFIGKICQRGNLQRINNKSELEFLIKLKRNIENLINDLKKIFPNEINKLDNIYLNALKIANKLFVEYIDLKRNKSSTTKINSKPKPEPKYKRHSISLEKINENKNENKYINSKINYENYADKIILRNLSENKVNEYREFNLIGSEIKSYGIIYKVKGDVLTHGTFEFIFGKKAIEKDYNNQNKNKILTKNGITYYYNYFNIIAQKNNNNKNNNIELNEFNRRNEKNYRNGNFNLLKELFKNNEITIDKPDGDITEKSFYKKILSKLGLKIHMDMDGQIDEKFQKPKPHYSVIIDIDGEKYNLFIVLEGNQVSISIL